jgi:hypothetical protein
MLEFCQLEFSLDMYHVFRLVFSPCSPNCISDNNTVQKIVQVSILNLSEVLG